MSEGGLFSTYSLCSSAAGVLGNLLAFVLFVSPIPTFRRIIRSKSTEEFSGLPYIYSLLNCLICLWYGTPIVSPGIILIFTVNSIGAIFQFIYIIIFIIYADRTKKVKMLGLLLAVFAVFGVIVFLSINIFEPPNRQLFIGYLSVFSLVSMFASPLFIINLVIKTKSVEYMPFYLSLATFLMSISFFAYGMFKQDLFISVPNGIGAILGIIQLVLYFCYSRKSGEESRRPLLESYA
ncbi:bidirectional sugar transporter SWEET2a-like [Olea europaea var. sylvestris]|uniref:Bidirectional sugar transporter SWEET n=1 Tax=Olea europaea subsp. europaea TaxID=158383 RepID=A0A8S0UEK8_OLEEU|nr:bidirectional sugar transporter SWEET2a-like [Olea europaea var. sylvestris]CAA3016740.1 bidirectional sugar transporter SWEET2a-like [Olea europaea subsp. europaea]